jgi:predicted RNA-binding Zn-ribbon protein involved in translation (DUF1610 family)
MKKSKKWYAGKPDKVFSTNTAKQVEHIVRGDAYICPTCGEIIYTGWNQYDDDEEYTICSNCGAIINETMIAEGLEPYHINTWVMEDVLDIEYTLDGQKRLIGVVLYLGLDCPTIWIDTRRMEIRSSEGWVEYLTSETCELLNDWFSWELNQ